MKAFLTTIKSEKAFSLLEMIIALGLGIICVVLFSMSFLTITNASFFVQETVTRNELSRTLKNAIHDRAALLVTATNNPLLNAVITNDFSLTGPMNTNQFYPISIYDSAGMRIAGPTVYYKTDGSICPAAMTLGKGTCLFSVTASFMVQGIPESSHLDRLSSVPTLPVVGYATASYPTSPPSIRAELILVNYVITFAPKPGGIARKSTRGSVLLNLRDTGL